MSISKEQWLEQVYNPHWEAQRQAEQAPTSSQPTQADNGRGRFSQTRQSYLENAEQKKEQQRALDAIRPQLNFPQYETVEQTRAALQGFEEKNRGLVNDPLSEVLYEGDVKKYTDQINLLSKFESGELGADFFGRGLDENSLAGQMQKDKAATEQRRAEQQYEAEVSQRISDGLSTEGAMNEKFGRTAPTEQQEQPEEEQSAVDRFMSLISGIGKGNAAAATGGQRLLYELGQGARSQMNEEAYAQAKADYDRALQAYEEELAAWGEQGAQSAYYVLQDAKRKLDAFGTVVEDEVQQKATQAASTLSQELNRQSGEDIAKAKEGLGTVGRIAVDTGAALGDILIDAASGMGALNMAGRVFGRSAIEAEAAGANTAQQLAYGTATAAFATGLNKVIDGLAGVYGKGFGDDAAEAFIAKIASTDKGRNVARAILNIGGEGAEEFTEGAVEPLLKLIYDGGDAIKAVYSSPEAWSEALLDNLYSAAIGSVIGAGGQAVDVARGGYRAKNAATPLQPSDYTAPKTGLKSTSPQNAQESTGGTQIPPSTQTASTGQTERLNQQDANSILDELVSYNRNTDENGFNVRNGNGKETVSNEPVQQPSNVDLLLEATGNVAEKPKENIDIPSEVSTYSPQSVDYAPMPDNEHGSATKSKEQLKQQARDEYEDAVRRYWEDNPNTSIIDNDNPLNDKNVWVERRYNELLRQEDDRVFSEAERIKEEIFNIKDDRNIPIDERLRELKRLADEEYALGVVEEKRDWHIVDGEIVDANIRKAKIIEEDLESYGDVALSNRRVGDKGQKGIKIYDDTFSRKLSLRDEPPESVGAKVTNQMRDMQEAERNAAHEAYKKDEAKRTAKKTVAPPKAGWNKPIVNTAKSKGNADTVLQGMPSNDKIEVANDNVGLSPSSNGLRLSEFSGKQVEKFKTKPAINVSKKEYAKVKDARITNYNMASDDGIPEIDAFPIAEYNKLYDENDTSYTYVIRNSGRDSFEIIGRYKTKNTNYIREAYANGRNGAQTQSSNSQNIDAENTRNIRQADSGNSRSVGQHGTVAGVSGNIEQRTDPEVSSGVNDIIGNSGDNVNNDANTVNQAEEDFGFAYESIQKSADKVIKARAFTDSDNFKATNIGKSGNAMSEAVSNLSKSITDFSSGVTTPDELLNAYKKAASDDALKVFVSDRIVDSLDYARRCYDVAVSDSSTRFDVKRYRHAADNAMKFVARRFEQASQAVENNISIASSAKKNAPKAFSKGQAGKMLSGYTALQISGPNVFRAIDGFDKNSGGIGYSMANAAEDCAVVESVEKVNGNKFFSKLDTKGKASRFYDGKEKAGTKIEGYELNQLQALHLIYEYKSLLKTDKNKLENMKGIAIPDGKGNFKEIDISTGEDESITDVLTGIVVELEDSLSETAKQYAKTMEEALEYYKPKLKSTTEDVYGVSQSMFEKGSYIPVRWHFKGKPENEYSLAESIEDGFSIDDDGSVNTPSILRSRSKKAGEYLVVEPITEVMNRYINQASEYIAYAGFAQRLELMNMDNAFSPSLSETLSENFGESFGKWMDDYVDDLRLSRRGEPEKKNAFLDTANKTVGVLRKNLQKGALLFNAGTPLKQGAAYWTSMGILKPEAVMKAWAGNPMGIRKDAKGNALYEGRRLGGMDPTLNDILKQSDSWFGKLKSKSKVINLAANAIGEADAAVVRKLFTATIYDVASDNPGLSKDSAKFKKLVEDKFEEVMLLTQSTSARTIAPALQRTDNELLKIMAMFRSQQMQELNKMIKLSGEAKAAKGTGSSKEASKALRDGITGQVMSYANLALMTAMVNGLLHKHDQYEDEEGNIDPVEVLKKVSIDFAENAAGTVWLGESVAQFLIEKITKENEFYGIPLGPLNTLVDFYESVEKVWDKPTLPNIKRTVGYAGTLTGIPLNNIYNMVNSAIMWKKDLDGSNSDDYDDVLRYVQNQIDENNKIAYAVTGASQMDRIGWLFGIDEPSAKRRASYDAIEDLMRETERTSYTPANFNGKVEYSDTEYELDEEQSAKFKETAMTTYYSVIDDLVNDAIYKNAKTNVKEAIAFKAKQYAMDEAKEQYFKSIGVDYESAFKKYDDGIIIRGNDTEGNPKPDVPPIELKDIPEYLAFTSVYSKAVSSMDYKSIDKLLDQYKELPKSSQMHFVNSYGQTLIDVHEAGVTAENFAKYKSKRGEGEATFDAVSTSNRVMLYALVNSGIPQDQMTSLANTILNKNALKAYNDALKENRPIKEAVDIYIKRYHKD